MKIEVLNQSLIESDVEAIVNAANVRMRGGGGIDGLIHKLAGPKLLEWLEKFVPNGSETGNVVVSPGFDTGYKYIFHTPGPIWEGGDNNEERLLSNCYTNALKTADELQLKSIAFCSISTGIYGFPMETAFEIAADVITNWKSDSLEKVIMAMYGTEEFRLCKKTFENWRLN